jgi:MFS family permease
LEAYAVSGGLDAYEGHAGADELRVPDVFPERELDPDASPGALSALQRPLFRRFAAGALLSLTGNWVEAASFGYVVLLLGGSPATLGVIGFLNTIPNLIWGLPAGVLADRYDRRRLLLGFQGANMAVAVLLAVLWQTGALTVPLMGAIAIVGGSLGTLSYPAFQGMLASTVPAADLESAVAVNSMFLQIARFVGPAIAGVLLAQGGPTWVFAVNAVSFLAVLIAVGMLPPARPPRTAGGSSSLTGSMREALSYVFAQRSLATLIGLTVLAGVFGTPPVAFMVPALAREVLGGGAGTVGALSAAIGFGSVVGALLLLRLARRVNKGEPVLIGLLACGLAIALIGVSKTLALSLLLAAIGGVCGTVFVGLATVVIQSMTSDALRARVVAIWAAAFVGLLPFGALITAGLTALVGPGGAVAIDGLVVVVGGALLAIRRPEITWLGCAALPEACIAGTNPVAIAVGSNQR